MLIIGYQLRLMLIFCAPTSSRANGQTQSEWSNILTGLTFDVIGDSNINSFHFPYMNCPGLLHAV